MRSPSPLCLALALALAASMSARAEAGALDDARAHAAAKRWPEAAGAFEKALSSAPRDAAIGLASAVAEGRLADRYDAAQATVSKALKAAPDDRDLRIAAARLFFARSADDPRWHADVEHQYRKVLEKAPDDEEATAGLAQMYLARADHGKGLEVADAFLAKHPKSGRVARWKGEILYDQAVLAYQGGGGLGASKPLFEKALAALTTATENDPTSFDAWLKRGYAEQYLQKSKEAAQSYEKAIAADGESDLPIRGLQAVTPAAEWPARLAALAAAHPEAPMVLWWHGWALSQGDDLAAAEKVLRDYVRVARRKGDGWSALGAVHAKKGDAAGARKAFEAALADNPDDERAIEGLELPLRQAVMAAGRDVAKLKPLVAEYRRLFERAPRNPWIRNNLGFLLREAFGPNESKAGAQRPRWILDESVRAYEEAAAIIGEYTPDQAATVPYPRRHGHAQVLNDTGLMYQYYPDVRDLAKAEAFYRRAQEWTDHGYWDAYTNLVRILREKERWKEALEYAESCAEGLKEESGAPAETFRATARGDAEQLRKRVGSE